MSSGPAFSLALKRLPHCIRGFGVCAGLIVLGLASLSPARAADDPVRIGILTDMSGNYADVGGMGSVVAAKMAVEDFGSTVLGRPIGRRTIRIRPMWERALPAAG
jgi:hypothetical protein